MNHFRTTPIKLAEGNPVEQIPNQVQLMRTCTFYHKQYGKVEITRRLFDEMVENFSKKVRGIDLMIDYSHDSDKEAAGWIKGLNVREVQLSEGDEANGIEPTIEHQLWADVEWTPKGRKTLSDKEFAYLSADFDPSYKDNENPTHSFGAVLLGAGLTNRPVIKRMNPAIQLSEFSETDIKENGMTLEEIQKELDDTKVKLSESEKSLMEKDKELEEKEKSMSDGETKLAQIDQIMNDLGVSSIEELMAKIAEMRKENVELSEDKKQTERENKLNVLLSEGKISQAQKEKALKIENDESFNSFMELAEMNEKVVKLSEDGSNETPGENSKEGDVEGKVLELAEKKANDDGISMTDAITHVLSENKELASQYYNLGE